MRNDFPALFAKKVFGFWIDEDLITIDFFDGSALFAVCDVVAVPAINNIEKLVENLQGYRIVGSRYHGDETYGFTFMKWFKTITLQLQLTQEKAIEYRDNHCFIDFFPLIKIKL